MNGGSFTNSSVQNPTNVCYSTPGVYQVSLTATSNYGCTSTLQTPYLVTAFALPVAGFVYNPQPTTILNPNICFTDSSTGNVVTWNWDFGDPADPNNTSTLQSPCHTYQDTGTYCARLDVVNGNGCTDSITWCVRVDPDFVIFVPNAFTPNGDGHNEIFMPQGMGIDENNFEMWIFDRWGNNIFYTQKWGKGWDGTVNGSTNLVQEDVYVWKIVLKDFKDEKHQYVGHVSMIR